MQWTKESDRQESEDATDFLQSTELQALIARLRPERIRRGLSMGSHFTRE